MAVATIAATLLTGMGQGNAAPAQTAPGESFNKGTGSAIANGVFVEPVAGGLSFGLGIGQALAGHQNTVGSAESRAFDLGVIGVTLAAQACDGDDPTLPADQQPQPLRTSSSEEGSAEGKSAQEPFAAGQIEKFVRATDAPLGQAITTGVPIEIPGVLTVSGIKSTATSSVVDDAVREAIAVTEIAKISLAGLVEVNGLRWEAVHRSDADGETPSGAFSVEGASIGGVPIPTGNPFEALAQLNGVLGAAGLELRPPAFRVAETADGTIAVVDPLALVVVPNATRDGLVGPILGAAQPGREALFAALLDADCGLGTYITVTDVILAGLSGGGFISMALGGATATTAPIDLFQGLGEGGLLPPLPDLLPGTGLNLTAGSPGSLGAPGLPAIPGLPATPGATGGAGAPTGDEAATGETGPVERIASSGDRGGVMAAVSAAALLLLLAVAEADRRKMQRARRDIAMEV